MSFAGEIQTMPLCDILQWVELNQKSGVLEVRSGSTARRFSFYDGLLAAVTSSEDPAAASEPDVRRILVESLKWTQGRFQFVEKRPTSGPALGLSSRRLLLEACRELDEERRDGRGSEPSRSARPSASPTKAERLRLVIIDRLLRDDIHVPLLPSVVGEILEITRRSDFSFRDLSNVIVTDQVIAAHLLRNANSAYYGSHREVRTIHGAVKLLGSQAVTNIVLALSLRSMGGPGSEYDGLRHSLWERSVLRAVATRSIAKSQKRDPDLAFLCGLLMDFGKNVLLAVIEETVEEEAEFRGIACGEVGAILEAFHAHVGGIVGSKWSLPAAVREAMRGLKDLYAIPAKLRPLIACATVGDFLAGVFGGAGTERLSRKRREMVERAMLALPGAEILKLSRSDCAGLTAYGPKFRAFAREFVA